MPECVLCGKRVPLLNKIEVEGAIVEVCEDCMRFGKVTGVRVKKPAYKLMAKDVDFSSLVNDTIFETDYGKRVREAREARGLTRTEFAKRINERESIIRRIEHQTLEPSDELTQKIERFLNIKLREEYE